MMAETSLELANQVKPVGSRRALIMLLCIVLGEIE